MISYFCFAFKLAEVPEEFLSAISSDQWTMLLEQSMLLLIIFSRWLMPKGDMTRDQLSSLLLTYVGTASDCVDFFAILAEDEILAEDVTFKSVVLAFYSWSLLQFMFVKTIVQDDDEDEENDDDDDDDDDGKKTDDKNKKKMGITNIWKGFVKRVLQTEIWAILVTLIMQDGPFFVIRMSVIFMYNVMSETHVFFTAKNALMIMLQVYRGVATYQDYKEQQRQKKEDRKTSWKELYKKISFMMAFTHGKRAVDAAAIDIIV
jgi:hypothetical protein